MSVYMSLHTGEPGDRVTHSSDPITLPLYPDPSDLRITHITIYQSAFRARWWHRLIPLRWRPSPILASYDLTEREEGAA